MPKSRPSLPGSIRTLPLGCVLGILVSCGEAATPPPSGPPVAWVAGDTLWSEGLARFFVLAQPLEVDRPVAEEVARHWVHVRAAAALAGDGSAIADAVIAEALADSAVSRMRRALRGDPDAETAAVLERVYAEGELRLIAHVLRRVARTGRREDRELQRRTAHGIARELANGGSWEEANARSEDLVARGERGIIGLSRGATFRPPSTASPSLSGRARRPASS